MVLVGGVEMPLAEKREKKKEKKREADDQGKNGKIVSIIIV